MHALSNNKCKCTLLSAFVLMLSACALVLSACALVLSACALVLSACVLVLSAHALGVDPLPPKHGGITHSIVHM